jgi:cysteinyl-tRNA synthetase
MLKLFNTLGKKIETFSPADREVVDIFTCGPSVYQRAHIGNFRTFLFEDILVRYLMYSGYKVQRGMSLTDVEDKAIREADARKTTLRLLTGKNIKEFLQESALLHIRPPDFLPRASGNVERAVDIIRQLLDKKIAYWYRGSVYFDPLKFPGFGRLYGLDMSKWPEKKRRFHQDTYPGIQWNLGDFILWHGGRSGVTNTWDTKIGVGRPSWNIQDPSMICRYFNKTLSIYCGGIDNLYRHHDYNLAILESVRPFLMARYWLHGHHLYVNGKKMSKSRGNIYYTDTLLRKGFSFNEIRFFLIYNHYRERLDYTDEKMQAVAVPLRSFREGVAAIEGRAAKKASYDAPLALALRKAFISAMDNDLDVKGAFDGVHRLLCDVDAESLKAGDAAAVVRELKEMDEVLRVFF